MAALNALCPKCGQAISLDKIRRIDFDSMACPKLWPTLYARAGRELKWVASPSVSVELHIAYV
jgi:hypothetical protein